MITYAGQVSGDVSRNKKFKAEATAVPQMQPPGKIMLIKETKIPPNSDTAILKKKNQTEQK